MFTIPVWNVIGLVLVLVSAVILCLSKETNLFRFLCDCFYTTWAVLVSSPAPKLPKTWRIRIVFFAYLSYCFAFSTVFQAFFTSYLVEPGYEPIIENIDELVESGLYYGYVPLFHVFLESSGYTEYSRLKSGIQCDSAWECIGRVIIARDVTILMNEYYPR